MYTVDIGIVGKKSVPGGLERITDSVNVSVERAERMEALALALDVLGRLSVPLDARPVSSEQQGRIEDAPRTHFESGLTLSAAWTPEALAEMITGRLEPLIAEIALDPGGEWFNGTAPFTMERIRANILSWLK